MNRPEDAEDSRCSSYNCGKFCHETVYFFVLDNLHLYIYFTYSTRLRASTFNTRKYAADAAAAAAAADDDDDEL